MWGKRSSRTFMDMKSPAKCKVRVNSRNRVGYPWMITLLSPLLSSCFFLRDEVLGKVRLPSKCSEECSAIFTKLVSLMTVPVDFNGPKCMHACKMWMQIRNDKHISNHAALTWETGCMLLQRMSNQSSVRISDSIHYRRPKIVQCRIQEIGTTLI